MPIPLSHLTGTCLTLALCLLHQPAAQASAPDHAELQQLACAASIELFMQAGSRSVPNDRPELAKLQALSASLNDELRPEAEVLVDSLQQAYQQLQKSKELPWSFNEHYSQALLGLLTKLQAQGATEPSPLHELPERLNYVATLYVARAEIGGLRPAREQGSSYLGKDIDLLAQGIERDLQQANWPAAEQPEAKQLLADARLRWKYIAPTLLNYKRMPPTSITVQRQAKRIAKDLRQLRDSQNS